MERTKILGLRCLVKQAPESYSQINTVGKQLRLQNMAFNLSQLYTVCLQEFLFVQNTVKPAYVVISIMGSPVLSSHLFWVPWTKI